MNKNEKQSVFGSALLGGGIGAIASPSGHRGEGAVHGAGRGVGTDVGASVGGLAGGLAGLGIGTGLSNVVPEDYQSAAVALPTLIGALGGAGLGGYGGYHAGAGVAKGLTGKNAPWQAKAKAKKKPAPKKEEADEPEAKAAAAKLQANIDNIMARDDVSLSEKAAMVNAAVKQSQYAYGMGMASAAGQAEQHMKQQEQAAAAATNQQLMAGGGGMLAGGAAGALLSKKNKLRNAILGAALGGGSGLLANHLMGGGAGKTASLKDMQNSFFEAQREIGNRFNALPEGVQSGLGLGGVGGAALGGLAGLIAPGHENEYDDEGNVIGQKQRGRFGAALRGVLGGGAAGLAAGGAAGYFAPEHTKSVMNNIGNSVGQAQQYGKQLYDRMFKPQLTATPQGSQPGQTPYAGMA